MSAQLAPVFAALADDTRWAILTHLSRRPASATALAHELPVSRQAIVKHLEVLRASGLVETRREGREIVYRALGSRLDEIARELEQIAAQWRGRLQHIKQLAEEAERHDGSHR